MSALVCGGGSLVLSTLLTLDSIRYSYHLSKFELCFCTPVKVFCFSYCFLFEFFLFFFILLFLFREGWYSAGHSLQILILTHYGVEFCVVAVLEEFFFCKLHIYEDRSMLDSTHQYWCWTHYNVALGVKLLLQKNFIFSKDWSKGLCWIHLYVHVLILSVV